MASTRRQRASVSVAFSLVFPPLTATMLHNVSSRSRQDRTLPIFSGQRETRREAPRLILRSGSEESSQDTKQQTNPLCLSDRAHIFARLNHRAEGGLLFNGAA